MIGTTYKCADCGEVFTEYDASFEHYIQAHPYGEGYADEEMCEMRCPCCYGEDFEEYFDEEDESE